VRKRTLQRGGIKSLDNCLLEPEDKKRGNRIRLEEEKNRGCQDHNSEGKRDRSGGKNKFTRGRTEGAVLRHTLPWKMYSHHLGAPEGEE